jgi:hypothetical protein
MASTNHPYQRLPGTGYRRMIPGWAMLLLFFVIGIFVLLFRGRRIQLWQGEDHLLLVEYDGAREYYKRFGYRDIQAIIIRKTNDALAANIVLMAIVGFLVAVAISVSDPVGRITLLVVGGFFGLLLVCNALPGPSCQCWIRTAVQTDDLPSLSRLRRARKVLERLQPLIAEAQGQLAPEEVAARMQELMRPTAVAVEYGVDDPNAPPRMVG